MFIDVIDSLCKANNTSVTAVCKELGISTSKPTAWRNGSTPNSKFVVLFAQYFGVTTDYLLGVSSTPISNEKKALIDFINLLPDEKASVVLQLIRSAIDL